MATSHHHTDSTAPLSASCDSGFPNASPRTLDCRTSPGLLQGITPIPNRPQHTPALRTDQQTLRRVPSEPNADQLQHPPHRSLGPYPPGSSCARRWMAGIGVNRTCMHGARREWLAQPRPLCLCNVRSLQHWGRRRWYCDAEALSSDKASWWPNDWSNFFLSSVVSRRLGLLDKYLPSHIFSLPLFLLPFSSLEWNPSRLSRLSFSDISPEFGAKPLHPSNGPLPSLILVRLSLAGS
jgi:hypothetical protein